MGISLETLGRKVLETRGEQGIRAAAVEIGVSPATLSRIERGHVPDIETFRKVCEWLEVNPGDVLGSKFSSETSDSISVHFKKDRTLDPKTAQSLADMILAAQRAMEFMEREE